MVIDAVAKPQPLDADTVYVVVIVGVTVTTGPFNGPGLQAKGLVTFVADAIRLTDKPWQIDILVADRLIVGG